MSRPPAFVLLASILAGGCASPDARREAPVAGLRFTDVTDQSGITILSVNGDPAEMKPIPESLGQGAAAIDFDRDGLLDLFVPNGEARAGSPQAEEAWSALYRNLGDLRFVEVGAEAGVRFRAAARGASAVDFDADGFTDLYVTIYGAANRFFRNRGDGTFEDASSRWGGADPGPSTAAAFFDADADSDLDLYVGNYVLYDPARPPNHGQPCEWRGLRVFCGPQGLAAVADRFYENRDGALFDATEHSGFDAVDPSYTLGAATGDFDEDGDPDLYVVNDSRSNYLFENLGGGRFREAATRLGVDRNQDGREQAGMGVDFGDVDNDGRLDLFVTNFSHDSNTLYHNLPIPGGRGTFADATYGMKLGLASYPYLSWGARILDLDLDGWQDIVVVSGHVYPQVDQAAIGTSYAQKNQIFRNLGPTDGGTVTFEEFRPPDGDAFRRSAVSRGLAAADWDNDGDQDLLVTRIDGRPILIRNDSTLGHWIGFVLRGSSANPDAIGARLVVEDAEGVVRLRERGGGGSYLSTGDPRLVVGLGPSASPIREVRIRWPDGRVARHPALELDRYWVLEAGAEIATVWAPRLSDLEAPPYSR